MMQAVMLLGNQEEPNQLIYMLHCGGKKKNLHKVLPHLDLFWTCGLNRISIASS